MRKKNIGNLAIDLLGSLMLIIFRFTDVCHEGCSCLAIGLLAGHNISYLAVFLVGGDEVESNSQYFECS
jgi:hypothetical protein